MSKIKTAGDQVELRKYVRFRLEVPVIFSWRNEQGIRERGDGFTRDISNEGLFIFTLVSPPRGVGICFDVFLPPLHDAGSTLQMHGEGQVVRVEPTAGSERAAGFAAFATNIVLQDVESSRSASVHRAETSLRRTDGCP